MIKYILYFLLVYVLYRFVTGFLIPAFRTGKQIKKQFSAMQQQMHEQMQQQEAAYRNQQQAAPQNNPKAGSKEGEYIDFEEVKS